MGSWIRLSKILLVVVIPFATLTGVVMADTAGIPNTIGIVSSDQFTPPATIPGTSEWLSVSQIHQETNLCVPTSAAMVLSFYQTPHSPRELKVWSRGENYDSSQPFNDFTITYFTDLLSGLQKHGIFWNIEHFDNDDTGYTSGLAALLKRIDLHQPVIVDTSLYTGHTFVVAGYRDAGSSLLIVDPFINAPGIREITSSDFRQIWNSSVVGSNRRAAVFTGSE